MGILRRHAAPDWARLEKYNTHVPDLMMLAFSSAEYCLAEEKETNHYGLESDTYAHASSPIRRYADLVNQRILKLLIRKTGERFIVPQAMVDMNLRSKVIKRFARDLDFLRAIQEDKTKSRGIILDRIPMSDTEMKIRLYIPTWKRIISVIYKKVSENMVLSRDETAEIDVTEFREVTVKYALNHNLTNWKDRMIISIE